MRYPKISAGERALIAGRTGSGKSTLACWLLNRSQGKWIILNPKHTAAYKDLDDAVVVNSLDLRAIHDELSKPDGARFIIVNPTSTQATVDEMDDFILWLHETWANVSLCCDELYAIHKNGVAGQGLIGWLTRGRELNQSFLGLTQRPAWLSQFLYSESDYIGSMSLQLRADRKRLVDMTDVEMFGSDLQDRHWLWYNTRTREVRHLGAVPV